MERIAELSCMVHDEVDGARKYAKRALLAKDLERAQDARTFAEMANQELGHADKLHDMATDLISEAKRGGAEVPSGMEKVWGYEHGRIVEETAAVRSLLQMLG